MHPSNVNEVCKRSDFGNVNGALVKVKQEQGKQPLASPQQGAVNKSQVFGKPQLEWLFNKCLLDEPTFEQLYLSSLEARCIVLDAMLKQYRRKWPEYGTGTCGMSRAKLEWKTLRVLTNYVQVVNTLFQGKWDTVDNASDGLLEEANYRLVLPKGDYFMRFHEVAKSVQIKCDAYFFMKNDDTVAYGEDAAGGSRDTSKQGSNTTRTRLRLTNNFHRKRVIEDDEEKDDELSLIRPTKASKSTPISKGLVTPSPRTPCERSLVLKDSKNQPQQHQHHHIRQQASLQQKSPQSVVLVNKPKPLTPGASPAPGISNTSTADFREKVILLCLFCRQWGFQGNVRDEVNSIVADTDMIQYIDKMMMDEPVHKSVISKSLTWIEAYAMYLRFSFRPRMASRICSLLCSRSVVTRFNLEYKVQIEEMFNEFNKHGILDKIRSLARDTQAIGLDGPTSGKHLEISLKEWYKGYFKRRFDSLHTGVFRKIMVQAQELRCHHIVSLAKYCDLWAEIRSSGEKCHPESFTLFDSSSIPVGDRVVAEVGKRNDKRSRKPVEKRIEQYNDKQVEKQLESEDHSGIEGVAGADEEMGMDMTPVFSKMKLDEFRNTRRLKGNEKEPGEGTSSSSLKKKLVSAKITQWDRDDKHRRESLRLEAEKMALEREKLALERERLEEEKRIWEAQGKQQKKELELKDMLMTQVMKKDVTSEDLKLYGQLAESLFGNSESNPKNTSAS